MAVFCRRQFITRMGLSGAASFALSPLLQRLIGEAMGAVPNQRRAVFVNLGHGISESTRKPPAVRSNADFDLPERMLPLEPHKRRLLLFDGLYNTNHTDLHGPAYAYYSCTQARSTSIDQVIAAAIAPAPRGERSVHLGVNSEPVIVAGQLGDRGGGVFSRGAAAIVPYRNPIETVRVLFGQVPVAGNPEPATNAGGAAGADAKLALLAFMAADIKRARAALAGAEREKLDLYLGSIEQMEARTRLVKTTPIASAGAGAGRCGAPDVSKIQSNNVTQAYQWDRATGAINKAAVLRDAYSAIATNVIACGISNVVTIEMYNGGNSIYLLDMFEGEAPELSNGPRALLTHLHDIHHGKIKAETYWATLPSAEREAVWSRVRARYIALAVQAVRQIADGLAAMPEAGGSMLDNTLIVWGSDSGGDHHNGGVNLPVVMLGGLAGQLTGPRYFKFKAKTTPQTELWLALANLFGVPISKFGEGGLDPCAGPLALQ
jgi:hypothetical protein